MRTGRLAVFSNPKVLIVLVVGLLALFILSRASIFHVEPALDASWLQSLRQTAPLDIAQLQVDGSASNRCSRVLVERLLLIPEGQSCRFTIDQAPRSLFPLTRVLTMTMLAGEVADPVLVEMLFDDRQMTAEQRLLVDTPVAVEIPQGGGAMFIPTCANAKEPTSGCVIQVGADPGTSPTPVGLPTNGPGSK